MSTDPDSILVQAPPNVIVHSLEALADTAAQNQDSLRTQLLLVNSGALNAPAKISVPDSVILSNTGFSKILPPDSLFPIVLNGDDTTSLIEYTYNLGESYPTGKDFIEVNYSFSDQNSGTVYAVKPSSVIDSTLVLSRSQVLISQSSFTPDTVTRGQQNVVFQFTVQNGGESPALIDPNMVSIAFNNNHVDSLTSPLLPVVVAGIDSQEFVYNVDINPNSSIGNDPVSINMTYSDTISGKSYSDVQGNNNVDTLTIINSASIDILSVIAGNAGSPFDSVSIGSQNIPVRVRLRNDGEAPLLLDSLRLNFIPAGIYQHSDTAFAAPGLTLNAGESIAVNFAVDVDSGNSSDQVVLNATAFGRDEFSGTSLQEIGADTTDSWRLVSPANFAFHQITPAQVSQGQVVAFEMQLQNTGEADALMDSASTFISFGSDTIFLDQNVFSRGNSTATLTFETTVISLPTGQPVNGTLHVNNYFENGFFKSALLSPIPVNVFTPASVSFQSLTVPDTVAQEQNFSINLVLQNVGSNNAAAIIDSIV
ncbi:MAG: hypothetical protein GWN30_10730, partial [Gammaproteobacteria bacterium]|nr:hypothetical protein [Gammaproteobacteria bacterium]